jgi:hypothetical protein
MASAVVDQHAEERRRSMVIAYTALWQLRELQPELEPEKLREARIELRAMLDTMDPLDGPAAAPNKAERRSFGALLDRLANRSGGRA